jgi:hypothetical protein
MVRDHCHAHGWVRGIVCRRCNTRLERIDRQVAPRVEEKLLLALLAVRNRCPDCDQRNVGDLARPKPLRVPEPRELMPPTDDLDKRIERARSRMDAGRAELMAGIREALAAGRTPSRIGRYAHWSRDQIVKIRDKENPRP